MDEIKKLKMIEIVGKNYDDFWHNKNRYRVLKGSRGSKKSKTTALNYIFRLLKYKESNLLVVRRFFNTLRDSCFSDLCWAIEKLQVTHMFHMTKSPLEITHKETGQKILFRGLDNPLKLTSITVENGYLCWVWIEEAYEIMSEKDFEKLDMSIRGNLNENLFKQITFTFNPWLDSHWLKKRFFDKKNKLVFTKTTTYLHNEFLDEQDKEIFEKMREEQPQRFKVEGLGEWGVAEGLIFTNWLECVFDVEQVKRIKGVIHICGLDFGYSGDPTAFIECWISNNTKEIFVTNEFSKKFLTNENIVNEIEIRHFTKEIIIADSEAPKDIDDLYKKGLHRIYGVKKGAGSVEYGIKKMQEYKIYILPVCLNLLREFKSYIYDEKTGRPIEKNDHCIDALRYAVSNQYTNKTKFKKELR